MNTVYSCGSSICTYGANFGKFIGQNLYALAAKTGSVAQAILAGVWKGLCYAGAGVKSAGIWTFTQGARLGAIAKTAIHGASWTAMAAWSGLTLGVTVLGGIFYLSYKQANSQAQ